MNKDLKDLNIQEYFKKIGKKHTIRLILFIVLIGVVLFFSFQTFRNGQEENAELNNQLSEKESEELRLLREKKTQDELYMLLNEYAGKITEEDIHEHTLQSLAFFEELVKRYSLNNYFHQVENVDVIKIEGNGEEGKEYNYVHVVLGIEGNFENIMMFIEDAKTSNHPILLTNTQFIIDEDVYPEDHDFEIIKAQLDVYIFEENIFIERSDEVFFNEDGIFELKEKKLGIGKDDDSIIGSDFDLSEIIGDDVDLNDINIVDNTGRNDDEIDVEDEEEFIDYSTISISPFGMYSFEIEEEESDTYDEYQQFLRDYFDEINENNEGNYSDYLNDVYSTEITDDEDYSQYFE